MGKKYVFESMNYFLVLPEDAIIKKSFLFIFVFCPLIILSTYFSISHKFIILPSNLNVLSFCC